MNRVPAASPTATAGVVTRLLAAAVDLAVVLVALGGLVLVAAGARFLWSPASFRWPGELADGSGSRIEASLLAARMHLVNGARPLARDALARALSLAEPERRRRPFLRPGPSGRSLLAAFPDLVGAHAWLGLAPPAAGRASGPRDAPVAGTSEMPIEPLTNRETTVLVRMAQAMSAEDIANDLFLSVNTVKTHQRGIYRKLAVSRRNDAVRKARELGLV